MTRYIRVKSKITGHAFDIRKDTYDAKRHDLVKSVKYPETSRPRRTKPHRTLNPETPSRGGGTDPVNNDKE